VLWDLVRLGTPICGIQDVETGQYADVTVLMGVISATTLAANQIAANFASIVFMIPWSLSQAASIRVAHGIGAGVPAAARFSGQVAMLTGVAYMLATAVVMWTLPYTIAALYLHEGDPANRPVIELAAVLLSIAALFQVVDGLQVIASGALRGIKDVQVPLLLAVFGYWAVGLGSGYALAFPLEMGGPGLWWGLAFGLAISAALLTWRFFVRAGHLVRRQCLHPAAL
jgi:MATE family multidrug resistance protein